MGAVLGEEIEGWTRIPVASGSALLDRLATVGSELSPDLRDAIIEALDERAAALRFSDPTPFRSDHLRTLALGIVAFTELSTHNVVVGVLTAGLSYISLQIMFGIGNGLRKASDYGVTQIGKTLVDRMMQRLRGRSS